MTSTNSGATWVSNSLTYALNASVASSADGSKLALARAYGAVFTSTNSGATWTESVPDDDSNPVSVASSADGTKLAVAYDFVNGMRVWFIMASTNSGATWMSAGGGCQAVALSADEAKLVAVGGAILTSSNWGVSWVSNSAPITNWSDVVSSADGSKLVASVNGGGIWLSQSTPAPLLSAAPSAGSLLLSWTVPSLEFVLERNSDLTTTNWAEVPPIPTLNFTNLHYELLLPQPNVNEFYRLKH
jgi:hypothetical protein